jgi:hypothetical protein
VDHKGNTGTYTGYQKVLFTKRDLQVFFLLTAGLTLHEIADITNWHYRSVRRSYKRIVNFFGLQNMSFHAALARLMFLRWRGKISPAFFVSARAEESELAKLEEHLDKYEEYVKKLEKLVTG